MSTVSLSFVSDTPCHPGTNTIESRLRNVTFCFGRNHEYGFDAMELQHDESDRSELYLTTSETDLLHQTACGLLAASAGGKSTSINDFELGGLANKPLVGVFVTLRDGGQLRGCIGNFAASCPLSKALERAATGVISHDPRFPTVTPDELPQLSVDVSLLHTRELLGHKPQQRATQVQIGQHGLDIQFGSRTGLLLPSVALDLGCDAVGFLEAVSRKAGLPIDTWQDPAAKIYRFAALCFGGPFRP